jgi:hypothetical protein
VRDVQQLDPHTEPDRLSGRNLQRAVPDAIGADGHQDTDPGLVHD